MAAQGTAKCELGWKPTDPKHGALQPPRKEPQAGGLWHTVAASPPILSLLESCFHPTAPWTCSFKIASDLHVANPPAGPTAVISDQQQQVTQTSLFGSVAWVVTYLPDCSFSKPSEGASSSPRPPYHGGTQGIGLNPLVASAFEIITASVEGSLLDLRKRTALSFLLPHSPDALLGPRSAPSLCS